MFVLLTDEFMGTSAFGSGLERLLHFLGGAAAIRCGLICRPAFILDCMEIIYLAVKVSVSLVLLGLLIRAAKSERNA